MHKRESEVNNLGYNFKVQEYKGIRFHLIDRNYGEMKARRFLILPPEDTSALSFRPYTNQNVWIPNKHLDTDCILKPGENIDYVFRKATRQLELAGYLHAIPGIKRRNVTM